VFSKKATFELLVRWESMSQDVASVVTYREPLRDNEMVSDATPAQLSGGANAAPGNTFILSPQSDGLYGIEWRGQRLSAESIGRSTIFAQLVQDTDVHDTASRLTVPLEEDAVAQWLRFRAESASTAPEDLCNILQVLFSLCFFPILLLTIH
jgi:hypothetical protein